MCNTNNIYLVFPLVEGGGDLPMLLGLEVVLKCPLRIEVLPTGGAVTVRLLYFPR